jgi:RNA polymerase sigma-70 factor (ECF subfamily)
MESGKDKISFSLNLNNASELVSLIKNDDTDAFKNFFFLLQPGIYKFLLRFLSDPDAAKDLTQDTFINFWTHRHQLDSSKSAKAYLFKIARNLAVNYLDRNHFDVKITSRQDEFLAAIINPEEEYDKHFLMNEFQQAVNKLPERCRATFILCKYEGFEYSEIAEILNVSLQTVKNQMNKALSILKKLLAAHLE